MEMKMKRRLPALYAAMPVATLLVAACATPQGDPAEKTATAPPAQRNSPAVSPGLAEAARRTRVLGGDASDDSARTFKGTGVVVKGQVPGGGLPAIPPVQHAGGNVVLNFEGADLREVVKNILGDILNESYTID